VGKHGGCDDSRNQATGDGVPVRCSDCRVSGSSGITVRYAGKDIAMEWQLVKITTQDGIRYEWVRVQNR
jgi:hypothetical protein